MKFSILTLLNATGYFAVMFMAFTRPTSQWKYAAMLAWLAVVAYLLMLATDTLDRAAGLFGRVALGCMVAYLAFAALNMASTEVEPRRQWSVLPHQWATSRWVASEQYKGSFPPNGDARRGNAKSTIEPLLAYNTALVFGLLGGSAAVIRYRRLLRRAELKERSGA